MIPSSLRLKQQTQKQVESTPMMDTESSSNQKIPSSLRPKSLKPKQKETEFPFEGENDLEREIERNIAQQSSRIGETILGLPGDIKELTENVYGDTYLGIPKEALESITERIGIDKIPILQDIYPMVKDLVSTNLFSHLPTSEQLRKKSEELSKGYTAPQSEFEERTGEVMQDIASMMMPGSNSYSFLRNLGIPLVANLAQEGINLGGGESFSQPAKYGIMAILDLINHKGKGPKQYISKLFDESESLIQKGEKISANNLSNKILDIKKNLQKGGTRPSTSKAIKKTKEILKKIKNGEIEVEELVDFRKSINENIDALKGFTINKNKSRINKKSIKNLQNVKSAVLEAIEDYGLKNPEFGKLNTAANEAYSVYSSSNVWSNFIEKTLKGSIRNPTAKALLGLSGGYGVISHPTILAKTAVAAPVGLAGYNAYKILHRVIQSPTLRKYYGNILKGTSAGNAAQVIKNAKLLEKKLDKEEKEDEESFF